MRKQLRVVQTVSQKMISKSAATFCCAPAPGAIIAEHNMPNEKKYHPTIKASNCSYLPFFFNCVYEFAGLLLKYWDGCLNNHLNCAMPTFSVIGVFRLLLRGCYVVATLLLRCCYVVVTLLLRCCYVVVVVLLRFYYVFVF